MSKEGRKAIDVGVVLQGGPKVLLQVLQLNNPVVRLVNDAKNDELWTMLEMLRGTEYLSEFLRAVMELPMEIWNEQILQIHRAFFEFNASEITALISVYQATRHDSPIMAHLNYDTYWTHAIETEVAEKDFSQARKLLEWAEYGLANGRPIPGIISSASKKCLAKLGKQIKAAKRAAK